MAGIASRCHGPRGKLRGAARYIADGTLADQAAKRKRFEETLADDDDMSEVEREQQRAEYNATATKFDYTVDVDCWVSVEIYQCLQEQWQRGGMDLVPYCLPVERIEIFMSTCYRHFTPEERCITMNDVMLMSAEAMIVFAEIRAQASGEQPEQGRRRRHG